MKITPSKNSLRKTEEISKTIPTFHHHYHMLYDIREQFYKEDSVTYLEIWAYAGASSALMLSYPKDTFAYSIDIGHPISRKDCEKNIEPYLKPTVNKIASKHYRNWNIIPLPANTLEAKPKSLQNYNEIILRRK